MFPYGLHIYLFVICEFCAKYSKREHILKSLNLVRMIHEFSSYYFYLKYKKKQRTVSTYFMF